MNLALVAASVLAVGTVGVAVVRHTVSDIGEEGAKQSAAKFMAFVGENASIDSLKIHDDKKSDFYTVALPQSNGSALSCFVYRRDGTVLMYSDSAREDDLRNKRGLTERMAFKDQNEAQVSAKAFVESLNLTSDVKLEHAKFEQNEWRTQRKPGRAYFNFPVFVNGYKYLDRDCGIRVTFDAETGKLIKYRRHLERMFAPVPCDLPVTKLSVEEAWSRYNPTHPQPPTVKIGWVQPKGSLRARLCYSFESPMGETTTASQVFVDAETATRVEH